METRILKVPLAGKDESALGRWARSSADGRPDLTTWEVPSPGGDDDPDGGPLAPLREAAHLLRTTDVPVAFPTETVYGLGADATRSAAVRGIYAAKGRPSDNPLIVHVSDLTMLRRLLAAPPSPPSPPPNAPETDPIPPIYHPLIARFWPGPLTILLPLPSRSSSSSSSSSSSAPPTQASTGPLTLAPEVTAGLPTFGARMPASALARTLIALAGAPLAAPSANASTRPSPTAAAHVRDDLAGRVALVLDGGACAVGVESTVVDGLCDPPAVLRPGGVGIEEIRRCGGPWERVVKAYKDGSGSGSGKGGGGAARAGRTVRGGKGEQVVEVVEEEEEEEEEKPRAPGMKYKHYSPRARVVLYEAGGRKNRGEEAEEEEEEKEGQTSRRKEVMERVEEEVRQCEAGKIKALGFIRTGGWEFAGGMNGTRVGEIRTVNGDGDEEASQAGLMVKEGRVSEGDGQQALARLLDVDLGSEVKGVAHGLFAALRELDRLGADVIFVEGVSDGDDIAAAVMNRLRKAASEIRP